MNVKILPNLLRYASGTCRWIKQKIIRCFSCKTVNLVLLTDEALFIHDANPIRRADIKIAPYTQLKPILRENTVHVLVCMIDPNNWQAQTQMLQEGVDAYKQIRIYFLWDLSAIDIVPSIQHEFELLSKTLKNQCVEYTTDELNITKIDRIIETYNTRFSEYICKCLLNRQSEADKLLELQMQLDDNLNNLRQFLDEIQQLNHQKQMMFVSINLIVENDFKISPWVSKRYVTLKSHTQSRHYQRYRNLYQGIQYCICAMCIAVICVLYQTLYLDHARFIKENTSKSHKHTLYRSIWVNNLRFFKRVKHFILLPVLHPLWKRYQASYFHQFEIGLFPQMLEALSKQANDPQSTPEQHYAAERLITAHCQNKIDTNTVKILFHHFKLPYFHFWRYTDFLKPSSRICPKNALHKQSLDPTFKQLLYWYSGLVTCEQLDATQYFSKSSSIFVQQKTKLLLPCTLRLSTYSHIRSNFGTKINQDYRETHHRKFENPDWQNYFEVSWLTALKDWQIRHASNLHDLDNLIQSIFRHDLWHGLKALIKTHALNEKPILTPELKQLYLYLSDEAHVQALDQVLSHLAQGIRDLRSSIDPDLTAHKILKCLYHNQAEPLGLYPMHLLIDQAPDPVKLWMQQIFDQTLRVLFEASYRYFNQYWHKKIVAPLQRLKNKFPIKLTHASDMSAEAYAHFIQADVSPFLKELLPLYFNTEGFFRPLWQHHILLHPRSIQLIIHLNDIVTLSNVQDNESDLLAFKFIYLDKRIEHLSIHIGHTQWRYAFGPQHYHFVDYHFNQKPARIAFEISDFKQHHYQLVWENSWALFHCIHYFKQTPISNTVRKFEGKIGPYTIQFLLKAPWHRLDQLSYDLANLQPDKDL